MGKKGGGGGSAVAPTVPQGLKNAASDLGNIGAYESSFLNEPLSLGNWAMNLATGGWGQQVNPGIPFGGGGNTGLGGTQDISMNSNPTITYGGGWGTPGDSGNPASGNNAPFWDTYGLSSG